MAVLAGVGFGVAVQGLVTPGDPARTAADVLAAEGPFRAGIVCLAGVVALDVVVAWALYRVLAPVDAGLPLLAAAFRLVYAAVFLVAIGHLAAGRPAAGVSADVREVKMSGGLSFMVDEKMVACVSAGGGALLVRVSHAPDAEYLQVTGARRAEMGAGRPMGEGRIAVERAALVADEGLHCWVDAVLEFDAGQTAPR